MNNPIQIDRATVIELICQTTKEVAVPPLVVPEILNEQTCLFGCAGFLDSLSLVSVVLDVEQKVNDLYDLSISLADERSVSQRRSPFRSVASLTDFVLTLALEQQKS
jgi:acyl carrier protein